MSAVRRSLPGPDDVTRVQFANGLTVLVRENDAAPVVVLQGALRVGSVHDPAHLPGLANLTASLLTRGSEHYDFDRFNETVEQVGANLMVSADLHLTEFGLTALAEDFADLVAVLADVLRRPTFPEEHVERVRSHWLVRLQERAQDTATVASDRFYEALFGRQHGYGRPIVGYEEGVNAIAREDMAAFYRSHYMPEGGIIVVTGAVQTAAVIERLQAAFGDWQSPRGSVASPMPSLVQGSQRHFSLMADKVQSDVVVGAVGPARGHPDYYAVRVANCILGQFGMMGRLGERVREELGLAYYCYSATLAEEQAGTWLAAAGVAPANVEATVASILAEFVRLASQPVEEHELADTQAYLTGVVPLALETNQGVASTLFNMELYGLGLDYLARYPALITSVTAEEVQRVAAVYLQPETALVVVAGPEAG